MKPVLIGLLFLVALLVLGVVTGNWRLPMHWMLIMGGAACLISAMLTGSTGRPAKTASITKAKRLTRRLSFAVLLVGLPNLIVGIVLWFVMLPPG